MKLHLSNILRQAKRTSFVAKQQVWVGDDISTASSHSPRHWMWHGAGEVRRFGQGRLKLSRPSL